MQHERTTTRKIVSGSLVTQVRFSPEQAADILLQAALAEGLEVALPDFGEGEADSIYIDIRDADNNTVREVVTDSKEVVLVDSENDPVVAPVEVVEQPTE